MKWQTNFECEVCGQRRGKGQPQHEKCSKIKQANHKQVKKSAPRSLGALAKHFNGI